MTSALSGTSVKVGLLGAGTVGSALLELIGRRPELVVSKALVRDLGRDRSLPNPGQVLTLDADEVLASSDVVVELMGGTGLAGDLILEAAAAGKPVVTANKAVLAERWGELAPLIDQGRLFFEAAVMAGTPVIGPLTGALRGSRPLELHGILNGTCNHILGQLEQGVGYQQALAEAQQLGYAEADPSLDVDGIDAAHKLAVLARLVFDPGLAWEQVRTQTSGIRELTPAIVLEAMEDGGRVRLVASIVPREGRWHASVRPVYLPADHPLAGAASTRNGLLFVGDAVGNVVIAGAGAGALPTASGVLGDVLTAARGGRGPTPLTHPAEVPSEYQAEDLGEIQRV